MNRLIITFLLTLGLSGTAFSKTKPDTLQMHVRIMEMIGDSNTLYFLGNSYVMLFHNGESVYTSDSISTGDLHITIPIADTGNYYLIAFRPGYVPQRIEIAPSKTPHSGQGRVYTSDMDFVLFHQQKGEDYTFWRQPLGRIYFKNAKEGFVFDEIYHAYIDVKFKEEIIRLSKYHAPPSNGQDQKK